MIKYLMAAALAALLGVPAFAQAPGPAPGSGFTAQKSSNPTNRTSGRRSSRGGGEAGYQAYGAATPFGSPIQQQTRSARETAIRECSTQAATVRETTSSTMPGLTYRSCMAQRGQPE
jgi:hypothetical protein